MKIEDVFGKINPPDSVKSLGEGAGGISQLLSSIIRLIYVTAGIVFVFMVILSAFQWIVSGGDKEAVGNARKRLTFAIIGIIVLSLGFVIIGIIGKFLGISFYSGQLL